MHSLFQDFRYALRTLARRPGLTLVVVLTLALGIGANTAIFSVVNGVLLNPTPLEKADRLMVVWETDRNSSTTREPASVPDYLDFRERSALFQDMTALSGLNRTLSVGEGDPVRLAGLASTHQAFSIFGIRPLLGRMFTQEDDLPGSPPRVLIGENLWERSFGRDPDVVGREIRLNDVSTTIVGVLPSVAGFGILQLLSSADYARGFADRSEAVEVDFWLPLSPDPEVFPRSNHPIFVVGRLGPQADLVLAQQEMSAIAADLEAAYPENDGRGVFIEPLSQVVFGGVRPALLVLMGAVALVLLVACANVANLLLSRWASRGHEVAVRTSLGAGSGRLARQFFVEGMVMTGLGGLSGVALAVWGIELLKVLAPADIPRLSEVAVDGRVLAVTLVVSALAGLLFGMVPTLQVLRLDIQSALKAEAGRTTSAGREQGRLRAALVVAELALAVMLVVGAGLLLQSFWKLQQVDPGFRVEGVLKAEIQLPSSRYPIDFSRWPNLPEIHRFNEELLRRAGTLPGVRSVALAASHPLDVGFTTSFAVVGREAEARLWPEISIRQVSPGYLRTLGLSLIQGRFLEDSDGTEDAPVVVINQAAADRFFPDQDPVGQQMAFWGSPRTIVGVVANEKIHGLAQPDPVGVYATLAQAPANDVSLLLRVSGDPESLSQPVRQVVSQVDPTLATFGLEPLGETLFRSTHDRRFTMLLLGTFAGVALLLAVVGIYGVLSYSVSARHQELGIRMALGAQRINIFGLVMGQGLRLAVTGVGIGLVGAFVLTRFLSSLLFGVEPTDVATFCAASLALIGVALLASYVPARRATRVDPLVALRYE